MIPTESRSRVRRLRGERGLVSGKTTERRQTTILVVEDDRDICEILKRTLEANGYVVWCASSGAQALEVLAAKGLPDLALLDVMMPGMGGLDLGARIQATTGLPIIMLSARRDSRTITKAIKEIAEDYVCKPFDVPVLLARIEKVLKRRGPFRHSAKSRIRIDEWLQLEPARQTAMAGGRPVRLSRGENRLLLILLQNAGLVLSATLLQRRLWPQREYFDEGALRTMVYRLRKKIEPVPACPRYIITDRGIGYRFVRDHDPEEGPAK